MIENVENPKMVLEQHINEIRKALIETKVAIAKVESIPNQKAKLNYDVAMAEVSKWEENLRKAQQANIEHLMFYARERLKNHQASACIAESHVDKNTGQSDTLKRNLAILEKRLNEAESLMNRLNLSITLTNSLPQNRKNTRLSGIEKQLENLEIELEATKQQLLEQQKVTITLLKSNSSTLKVVRQLLIELDTDDTENKNQQEDITLDIQLNSPTAQELLENDLEQQLALLESDSDFYDELAAMKEQLSRGSVLQQDLPISKETTAISSDLAVDAELEPLRKQIESI